MVLNTGFTIIIIIIFFVFLCILAGCCIKYGVEREKINDFGNTNFIPFIPKRAIDHDYSLI